MSSRTVIVTHTRQIEQYTLSVTYRHDPMLSVNMAADLIEATVKLWLYVAKILTSPGSGEFDAKWPDGHPLTPEAKIQDKYKAPEVATAADSDPFVTVFDKPADNNDRLGFTLHSNSSAQEALDAVLAWIGGTQGFKAQPLENPHKAKSYVPASQNAPNGVKMQESGHSGKLPSLRWMSDAKALEVGSQFQLERRAYEVVYRNDKGRLWYHLYSTRNDGTRNQYPDAKLNAAKISPELRGRLEQCGAVLDGQPGAGEFVIIGEVVKSDRSPAGKTTQAIDLV